MYILAFDTNFTKCTVAITHNGVLVAHQQALQSFTHAEDLVSMIEQAITAIKINYGQISYLAITKGPGSFTGIRTGLAVAEALCFALPKLKPVTFSSFEVLAYAARGKVSKFNYLAVIFKATADTAYLQLFNAQVYPLITPITLKLSAIAAYLQQFEGLGVCIGNMTQELYPVLKPQNIIFLPYLQTPKVRHLASLALKRILTNTIIDSSMTPLYIAYPSVKLP